jgi:hypothetical protein
MHQKATLPIILVAVVALVGLMIFLGKTFMKGPAAVSSKEAGYPSFIDPVTHKPKGIMQGSSPAAPGGKPMGTSGSAQTGH